MGTQQVPILVVKKTGTLGNGRSEYSSHTQLQDRKQQKASMNCGSYSMDFEDSGLLGCPVMHQVINTFQCCQGTQHLHLQG